MKSVVRKAVIPAAGRGTRLLPATKALPKEMLPILDIPTIQWVVEEAAQSGIREILIITSRDKRAIEDHFDRNPELERALAEGGKKVELAAIRRLSDLARICYVRQGEARGLGHAIALAQSFTGDEPFAVLLGDAVVTAPRPCTGQLMEAHVRHGAAIVGLEQVPRAKVSRYGIIAGPRVGPRTWRVTDLVEKPEPEEAPSRMAIGGRYLLTPAIYECLADTPPGKNGEIQLSDALCRLAHRAPVYGYRYEGVRYDIGDRNDYVMAQIEFAMRRPELRRRLRRYWRRVSCLGVG